MDYQTFLSFPFYIEQITEEYNDKIDKIKAFILADMSYSGSESNLDPILPYFTFWYFCQDAQTVAYASTGENTQIAEFTLPAIDKQIFNWNTGVEKLRVICGVTDNLLNNMRQATISEKINILLSDLGVSINTRYLSKINVL